MDSKQFLIELLSIDSPTFKEKEKVDFLEQYLPNHLPDFTSQRYGNNLLLRSPIQEGNTHIAFVGHTDHVPEFFTPYEDAGNLHGAGASDMQAGLASMIAFVVNHPELLNEYNVTIILYDKEEGTTLHENGLKECLDEFPDFFNDIDVAIVGEPTNNAVQLGCVGSIHFTLTVKGQAAHSARPWFGRNALYEALPIIQKAAELVPTSHDIFGVTFRDVLQITESQSTKGRTTLPDQWVANINYRFSPVHTMDESIAYVTEFVKSAGLNQYDLEVLNGVDAGSVIEHPLLQRIQDSKAVAIEAKQAWTDVAQLTKHGICAFNFGPGRQDQAHHPNEYVVLEDMKQYEQLLGQLLLGG